MEEEATDRTLTGERSNHESVATPCTASTTNGSMASASTVSSQSLITNYVASTNASTSVDGHPVAYVTKQPDSSKRVSRREDDDDEEEEDEDDP